MICVRSPPPGHSTSGSGSRLRRLAEGRLPEAYARLNAAGDGADQSRGVTTFTSLPGIWTTRSG
jgi:hypothetical protein